MLREIIVIGSGPAGLTAAIYAARYGRKPLVLEGMQPGGQLTITNDVENFPGFVDPISGPALMSGMKAQAVRLGVEVELGSVVSADFSKRPFVVTTERSKEECDSVIIATGASARWLNIESEKKFIGKGVSACATCDGFFFKGMDVIVVGGGDTALEEAHHLARFASHVYVVHRRDQLRGSKALQDRAMSEKKISFEWNSVVKEILGDDQIDGVLLMDVKTSKVRELKCKGVFVAIGFTPSTSIFKGQIDLDDNGYIITKKGTTQTSVEGVFAAGDCMDPIYRQAIVAAGTGGMAAIECERYLAEQGR